MDSKNMGLFLLLIFAALISQTTSRSRSLLDTSMLKRHEQWMVQHNRVYKDDAEKYTRFNIFKENVEQIELFNKAENAPYKLGVNQFTDLTNEEFKLRNRFKSHVCSSSTDSFRYGNISAVPATIDWRKKGAVTPVKDQGQCGEFAFVGFTYKK
ncbi:senescence-specific cysteine protease SAG39-like [Impatiens glandulifera]|uniref:senescence-specific cysteine protease SAG39-like n=1 Tax=Impatiens glandulifera TaxID=253017 RepID=UPI001FB16D5A|nr:senescence-specific cysteine protease SAG39-like [Impatiens glandulifera]